MHRRITEHCELMQHNAQQTKTARSSLKQTVVGFLGTQSQALLQVYLDVRNEKVTRRFEVLFLNEQVRIVEFLSDKEPEPVIFIFKRVNDGAAEYVFQPLSPLIHTHVAELHPQPCLLCSSHRYFGEHAVISSVISIGNLQMPDGCRLVETDLTGAAA